MRMKNIRRWMGTTVALLLVALIMNCVGLSAMAAAGGNQEVENQEENSGDQKGKSSGAHKENRSVDQKEKRSSDQKEDHNGAHKENRREEISDGKTDGAIAEIIKEVYVVIEGVNAAIGESGENLQGLQDGDIGGIGSGEVDEAFTVILEPCLTDTPVAFHDGIILLERDGKYGYADYEGKYLTELIYDKAEIFIEDLAKVSRDGKYGFIDREGHEIIPLQYDQVDNFSNGVAVVQRNDRQGVIDTKGEIIVPINYKILFCDGDGNALIGTNTYDDKLESYRTVWGFYFYETGVELPFQFNYTSNLSGGYSMVVKEDKCALLGNTGIELTEYKYDSIGSLNYGMASVCVDDKWGFINTEGKEVVPPKYEMVYAYCYGRAAVCLDGKWGYLDLEGNLAIPLEYDFACNFYNGVAGVIKDGKYGMVDDSGKVCIPIEYDWLSALHDDGYVTAKRDGQFGYLDRMGKAVIPIAYDNVYDFEDGYAKVEQGDRAGYLDRAGKIVTPLIYTDTYGDREQHISGDYLERAVGDGGFEIPLKPDLNLRLRAEDVKTESALYKYLPAEWPISGFFDNEGNELISPGYGKIISIVSDRIYSFLPMDTNVYGKEMVFAYQVGERYGLFAIADDRVSKLVVYGGESQTALYTWDYAGESSGEEDRFTNPGMLKIIAEESSGAALVLDNNLTFKEEQYYLDELVATHTAVLPQFAATGKDDPLHKINVFYQEYGEEVKQVIEKNMAVSVGDHMRYYYDMNCKIKSTPRFINVILNKEGWFGGSHPNNHVISHVFNRATGERVALGDLFAVGEETYLPRLCDEIYQAMREGYDYQERYLLGGTYEEERQAVYEMCSRIIFYDASFYLDTDGVVFIFNDYTLTSYNYRSTWIKIPFGCLADILRLYV